jgi:PilZ domain
MLPRRTINGYELVDDLRSGMTDVALMQKYRISSKALQRIFLQLLQVEAVGPADIYERSAGFSDEISVDDMRKAVRQVVGFPMPIYALDKHDLQVSSEQGPSEPAGVVRDLSTKGLSVHGIEVKPDQTMTLAIQVGKFTDFGTFEFRAICRWSKGEGSECLSGFEITRISEQSREQLYRLIRALTPE